MYGQFYNERYFIVLRLSPSYATELGLSTIQMIASHGGQSVRTLEVLYEAATGDPW